MKKIITILTIFLLINTCDLDKSDIICTEIFAMVTIKVTGGDLDEYYTVRTSTNDTIRPYQYAFNDAYTVLDDNYLPDLRNDKDDFIFIGIINNQIVISEKFVIKADDCHIIKVRGPDLVDLK
ncbi:MAG: hypothetical protein L3J35_10845 [Bacteroidales bacterium]|nr:hypothetical protein [Bacteroidales bacterium]